MIWDAVRLSLQVTGTATLGIILFGLLVAWLLARVTFRGKLIVETAIFLPLVLPPTVLGYYLLFVLGRGSLFDRLFQINLLFTWQAAAIAAMIVGLPLMVQAARAVIEDVNIEVEDAARVDGASERQVLWHVTLPSAQRGILAGLILGSARALGEFGATLMVAGNIPGRTQTLPLAIYDAVQARRYDDANFLVLVMTSLAFAGLWLVYRLARNGKETPSRPW
jgi:molybdate transport system permease protein